MKSGCALHGKRRRNEDFMKRLMMYLKDYKKESILAPLFKLLEAFFRTDGSSGNGKYH